MIKKLKRNFFDTNTIKIAKKLLGKYLVRKIGNKFLIGKIVETEAYYGPNDKASHASRGKTERNEIMFASGGHFYVYLIYGMYNCLNIVTEKSGFPAAVLIRAVEPMSGIKSYQRTDGPGKLCKAFKIDKNFNGLNQYQNKNLFIAQGEKININLIGRSKRIGVDYAGFYKHKLWRFYVKNNKFVSKFNP